MELVFFLLKIVLVSLDILLTIVTFGWIKALKFLLTPEPLRSVEVDGKPYHRRHADFASDLLSTTEAGVETLYDLQSHSFSKYAHVNCVGTREFLGQLNPKVKKFGPNTQWKTYEEVGELSHKFGAALRGAGLVPAPKVATLDKISTPCSLAIFENTCEEWLIAALGAFSQSIVVTTIYSTLGKDAVIDAVNNGMIKAIVCNKSDVKALVDRLGEMPSLDTIIYTNNLVASDTVIEMPSSEPSGTKIISFEDFTSTGNTSSFPPTPPSASTCAVIMYTSGSTGKPKGVVINHANILSSIAGVTIGLGIKEGEDVHLGYLPLAHILELTAEFAIITLGCTICFADPRTLTTTGAHPVGALEQFKPTLLVGVPKIWDVIKKGVQGKIKASPPVARALVNIAFEWRKFAVNHGFDTPLFNALVFKKFKKVVGGRIRMGMSGGGPLNSEVQEFVRTTFGFNLFQGYGLTETTAGLSVQDPNDMRSGIVGVPLPCCEVKLESVEICDKAGLPYLTQDTVDHEGNPVFGRGEILVKGHNISLGYYMMPDKTKEEFRDDGFFQTGDIGQFMLDGSIRIVDRKKNLVKLKGGEYIAVELMEMTYNNSDFVDPVAGGICCYGDGDMDRPIGLMQLNKHTATVWAKEHLDGVDDWESIKTSQELYKAVLADLKSEAKKSGLSHLENLVAVVFLDEPFTPENGCLTAANKMQRRNVISKFEKEFEETKKKGCF